MDSGTNDLLERVVNPGLFVGSGVYTAIDPDLSSQLGDDGQYFIPEMNSSYAGPIGDLLKVSAFGGIGPDEDTIARRLFGQQPGALEHPIAGHYVGAAAGWAEDGTRANASSGGLTTWLLRELLRRGEIDGVIHMRTGGEQGQLFSYQVSRTDDEILAGAKSRYYPGDLSHALRDMGESSSRYALVAIPSFAYEIRLLQELNPTFSERIPYVIGLVCGHQKTSQYAEYLGWRAGIRPGDLVSIDFRKKVPGKPANSYSTELTGLRDGKLETFTVSQEDLWGTDWGFGFFKSKFSDFTEDVLNETADIVFGDAWLPQYVGDGLGTNVAIARNQHIWELLREGAMRGEIHLEAISIEDVVRSQGSLIRHNVVELPYRWRALEQGQPLTAPRRTGTIKISASRRWIQRSRLAMSRLSIPAYSDALRAGNIVVFDRALKPLVARYARAQLGTKVGRKVSQGPNAVFRAIWRRVRRS